MSTYTRPTFIFIVLSVGVMITTSLAVNMIPSKKRKGASFGMIIMGLILSIVSILYNFWLYAKETGMNNAVKQRGAAILSSFQAKMPAGATNIGAPTLV
jgi:hypothetical protein